MPCELTDGVSLLVEMFYQPSQDVRRYGGDNYGDGFYGNSNSGEPEPPYWVDVTRFCTYVSVQRGDLQPRIGQNTDQISIELMDNYGDVYGWQGSISLSSPQFNTPVRVSLVESDQVTTHIVATGRLDDVIERFGADSSFARIIEFRAYGQKTSLISSLLGEDRPIEFVDERIDAVLTAIGYPDPVQAYPAAFSTVRLRGDLDTRVADDAIAYVIIAQAAASAGYGIGTNAAGDIIWNQIGEPAEAPLFTIAECDGTGVDGVYTEATYQAGIDRVLNVVQLQNVVDPAAGAEAVDVVSVSKWGRRSQGFGMPIIVANDSQADAQGVADAILATTANIINRVADITFNTLTDNRWYGIFQSLDIDLWLDVQRSSPNPSNFTGEIIGLDFDIIPNEGITGTVHLSTRDETF